MTVEIHRASGASLTSVHVLIVVVGEYSAETNLPGAGAFAQEVADFWMHADREFPNPGQRGSLHVLASDAAQSPVQIMSANGPVAVQEPTVDNVEKALINWSERIRDDVGSMGVLHWVGHGFERALVGGAITTLLCAGVDEYPSRRQSGIDWASWLHAINEVTKGRQVYCFIDACRNEPTNPREYSRPRGSVDPRASDHVQVFTSAARGHPAFWIDQPDAPTVKAGFKEGPLGTRAFLAALESFGAETTTRLPMPVVSARILDASIALVKRWAEHQRLTCGSPAGPHSPVAEALLLTRVPKSVVDYKRSAMAPHDCEAQPDALRGSANGIENAETAVAPHQFRLAREPHRFRLDGASWSAPEHLGNPYVPI